MAVLLSTTLESAEYLDPMKRRLFVAQSWLLVHYLCAGDIARQTQLGSYVKELAAGTFPELALKMAFGVDHETLGTSCPTTPCARYIGFEQTARRARTQEAHCPTSG